jgi:hypothetical protein
LATVTAAKGGTGQTSYAVGDLLYASTSSALSKLADVATGNALISGGVGVAPSYGKIGLTTHISGTLAIGNGGTGQTTATAAFNALNPMTTTGDILYESSPTTAARLGIGSTGQVLTVAGGLPSWATPSSSLTVTNDTTTATALYPTFTSSTGTAISGLSVTSTKLSFVPTVGSLTAPQVVASNGIVVNSNTVSASYTIPAGSSGASAGPITVASGQTVTVSSGSRWVIS